MSAYLGDVHLGDTVDFKFTTVDSTGAPTTLAGSPVCAAYPDNSLTEVTTGVTLTVDFDGRTGMHNVRVVTTTGYAVGNYALVMTAGTVGGVSVVGYVVGRFSIDKRAAIPISVDGVTHADGMAAIYAVLFGKTAPSGSNVAFKLRDGTTTKVTVTYGTVDGERTASVIA